MTKSKRTPKWVFCCLGLKIFLIAQFSLSAEGCDRAVSYYITGEKARFGDHVLSYLHAKWISYRFGLPLLYKPFLYSEEFRLHDLEEYWTEAKEQNFERIIVSNGSGDFTENSRLYLIPFFSECPDDFVFRPDWIYFPIDWKDKEFCHLLRNLFSPRRADLPVIQKPNGSITVAVHLRKGGGYDCANPYTLWPTRFPPDSYYLTCLRKICALFPGKPIYAHLFTDDAHPSEIAAEYKKELRDLPITFNCRQEGNRHDAHVMEDFFAMIEFDCLIRSTSNFSFIPSVIGDYYVVMTPKHYTWVARSEPYHGQFAENYIDEIDVDIRKKCD